MELRFPFYQGRLKASNAVSRPLMFVSIWTRRWVNGQPRRLPVSQEDTVTAQVRASHDWLCSGHYLEAQPLRGLDTVQRSRVLDMRAGNRTAWSLLISLSIKRDGYTAVEPGAPFPFPHSRALQKQIRRKRKSVQPVFPLPTPRCCCTPPHPHPHGILISNRCMRTLALIKIPTNPEYEHGFLSVEAAHTVVVTSFGIGSQIDRTWIKKATLLGRLRARPGDIANHLMMKFETNCVMIDLPSLAMQNIMLPSLYASWAYCWLWQTEKMSRGPSAWPESRGWCCVQRQTSQPMETEWSFNLQWRFIAKKSRR